MRLTARGSAVLVVSVALVVFGQWAGYPLPRGLGAAGAVSVVAALVLVARRPRAELSRTVYPDRVERGRPALATVSVTNTSRRRQRGLHLTDGVAHAPRVLTTSSLPPRRSVVRRYELPTTRRGRHTVGPLAMQRTDPFGLARRRWDAGECATLWVHPRRWPARPLSRRLLRHLRYAGTHGLVRGVEDLREVREYVPGDDVRHVYWKATARTGTVMVRDLADPAQPRITVGVDTRAGVLSPELFEDAVDVAASVLLACSRAGYPTRLVTSAGRDRVFGSAESSGRALLDELCVVEQRGAPTDAVLSTASVARSVSDVLVLVTAASADAHAWRALALRCPRTVCVLLGDEVGRSVTSGLTVLRGPGAAEAVAQWNEFAA